MVQDLVPNQHLNYPSSQDPYAHMGRGRCQNCTLRQEWTWQPGKILRKWERQCHFPVLVADSRGVVTTGKCSKCDCADSNNQLKLALLLTSGRANRYVWPPEMLFCHYPPVQGPRTDLEGFSLATQRGGGDGTPSEFGEERERGDSSKLLSLDGGRENRSRESKLSRRQAVIGGNKMGCDFTLCFIQALRTALPDTRKHIQDMTSFESNSCGW